MRSYSLTRPATAPRSMLAAVPYQRGLAPSTPAALAMSWVPARRPGMVLAVQER